MTDNGVKVSMTKAQLLRERKDAHAALRDAWLTLHFNHHRHDGAIWMDTGRLTSIVGRALAAFDGGVEPDDPSPEAVRQAERTWDAFTGRPTDAV